MVAFEDIRLSLPKDSSTSTVKAVIDAFDDTIDDAAQSAFDGQYETNRNDVTQPVPVFETHEGTDFSDDHNSPITNDNSDASTVIAVIL